MKTFLLVLTSFTAAFAAEPVLPATPREKIEIKILPERIALQSESGERYFSSENELFRKLFRYISSHDIAMTTPVTVDVEAGRMRFFVGEDDAEKAGESTKDVLVLPLEPRTVVSIGYGGRYTEDNYEKALAKLQAWLEAHQDQWEQTGDPLAVYWNGPMTPGFFKRAEVMIPVKEVGSPTDE